MGLYSSDSGGSNYTPAPVGTHVARCFRIIDIGTQHGEYKGQPTRRAQIIVAWELPNEMIETPEGSKPVITSRFYTNSLGEKANLRHDLEAWRGRAFSREELQRFDLRGIVGKPCMLTIVGGDNDRTKVAAVSGLPRGMECPPQVNPSFTFSLDDFTKESFEALTEGIQNLIKKSEEYPQIIKGGKPGESVAGMDDDVPF